MKNVADIYPLTPVQSGMLFHTLAHDIPNHPKAGVYVNQFTCQLTGDVQADWLQQAWQQTVERHPALRTAVLWEGLDEPLQVVRQVVTLPWQAINWQGIGAAAQTAKLKAFLQRDRTQGFTLSQAPLLRLTLIQLTHNTYQFIWSNHHLLYDGWSLLLIWQDVLAYYAALSTGTPLELPAVRPFRDYVAWQKQQDLTAAKSFWKTQLQTIVDPTPLPAARSVSDSSSQQYQPPYRQQSKQLSNKLSQQLQAFSRQHRLTINTLVQGAWALLLSHYSDGSTASNEDASQVTYGSVMSGRPAALRGVETMVGLFINTLPVSVPVDLEQRLLPWLQARQQQLLALREHEATPLADIQRWSNLPKGSSLFESIVAFENLTEASTSCRPFIVSDRQYLEQSNYPLALLVFPQAGLDLRLLYDIERFEDNVISNLLTHLGQLLSDFVSQPTAKLANLPRLTPTEQQQLFTWPQADYPHELCIHQLIEAQAKKTPEAIALVFADESLTYAALNKRANQLAWRLKRGTNTLPSNPGTTKALTKAITKGDRIALCFHRSLDMIVGILATLKAGATYVPLDPTYPADRIRYCLHDTQPKLIITQRSVALSKGSVPCLFLDEFNLSAQPDTNPAQTARPQDLAYIIYTSGSTGQPKGVMVSHRNLMHTTTARFHTYTQPVERFLLLSSIAFDSSIAGVFWTLCQGGTLVLAPRRIEQDLQQLSALITQQQITHTLCVPTLYSLLLKSADSQQLSSLTTVIVAGEACSRTLAQQHYSKLPTAELYNEYGPTEGSVWCTAYRIPNRLPPGPIPIGKAISNAQIYLLNSALQPVPAGAVGEIYIGGEGVTQGYLNQPEKTAAVYLEVSELGPVKTSLQNNKSIKLYKTGDLGRYRADGNLEWLGRCDRQVKIRGYRIELGEIEEVLRAQMGIQEAVVVAASPTQITQISEQNSHATNAPEYLAAELASLSAAQAESILAQIEEDD